MSTNIIPTADPMKTRSGKIRLGPLSLAQLTDMLSKNTNKKLTSQIKARIEVMTARQPVTDAS